MRRLFFLLVVLIISVDAGQSAAWMSVPDGGDTGWQTYSYQAGPDGFGGTAGFVVSNVIDDSAYSELLLDNLSHGGDLANCSFEKGNYSGYTALGDSYAVVTGWAMAYRGKIYRPTQGKHFSDQGSLETGVSTAAFQNANRQPGTSGSILETAITLAPGSRFTFDWAFLGGDLRPWNDFALFYLKDAKGKIVYTDGLAQIGPLPQPAIIGILSSGLLSLLGPEGRARPWPADRLFRWGPGRGSQERPG